MKIKQLKNKQIIPYQDSAFCSTLHCPLYSALSLLKNIPTTATITIGMSECAFYSTKGIELEQGAHYNYVLDENELIFGYEEALKQAIQELMTEGLSNSGGQSSLFQRRYGRSCDYVQGYGRYEK